MKIGRNLNNCFLNKITMALPICRETYFGGLRKEVNINNLNWGISDKQICIPREMKIICALQTDLWNIHKKGMI